MVLVAENAQSLAVDTGGSSLQVLVSSHPARKIEELTLAERGKLWAEMIRVRRIEETEVYERALQACAMLNAATDDRLRFRLKRCKSDVNGYLPSYLLYAVIDAEGAALDHWMKHFADMIGQEGIQWQQQEEREVLQGAYTHIDHTYTTALVSRAWLAVQHPED